LRVLLGITGGIAAYKAASLIRLLTEAGHEVTVLPTENALRFIGKPTLEALSGHPVDIDMYSNVAEVRHVALGQNADLIIVAPATAAFLARLATGLADDLLLNAILASNAEVVLAPAMHTEMWQNPATKSNVDLLRARGVRVMDPATGRLTGADSGPGRLPEPEDIFQFALTSASDAAVLAGLKVLVTAGGTREAIDPVRFIGNQSSGKQGLAFARQAMALGASVKLIACNLDKSLAGAEVVHVTDVAQLKAELDATSADILVMAAAVSDFTVIRADSKLRRGELTSLALEPTPDLVAHWAAANPESTTLAFALEDRSDLIPAAREKLESKRVSAVLANRTSALGAENSEALFVSVAKTEDLSGSKDEVARAALLNLAAMHSAAKAKL
jgi:phosphopantothenoylcysteine decarboxylase/phosphopantothenate--cysteine ligase